VIKTLILTLLQNHVDQALNYKENPVWLFSILHPSIDRQLLRYTVQYFQQQRDQVVQQDRAASGEKYGYSLGIWDASMGTVLSNAGLADTDY